MSLPPKTAWRSDDPRRWEADDFLNELRASSDDEADACVGILKRDHPGMNFHAEFGRLTRNDSDLSGLPEPLRKFLESGLRLPAPGGVPTDPERWRRGADVFEDHVGLSCLSLLLKAVPEGYQAPNLTRVLTVSGELQTHTYRRLLGVLQMMVDVCKLDGCVPAGRALMTAQKLRLLHAGIRTIVRRKRPEFEPQYGIPVNHEDMLGTIMGFALLVVDGLTILDATLLPERANDYYYLWMVYAVSIGIYPAGEPDSLRYVPKDLVEARAFYAAYARRHYVGVDRNPDAPALTQGVFDLFADLVPDHRVLAWVMGRVSRVFMQELIGADAMRRLGHRPSPVLWLWRPLLWLAPRLWELLAEPADSVKDPKHYRDHLSRALLQKLVKVNYQGEVEFLVPTRLKDLRELVEQPVGGSGNRPTPG
jgi:hypothetical protein